jgi:hypothetical protein
MLSTTVLVRLTHAAQMNGIKIFTVDPGDVIELSARSASILIAEGWAEPVEESPQKSIPTTGRVVRS